MESTKRTGKQTGRYFFNWFYLAMLLLLALAVLVWYCYQLKLEKLEKEIKTPPILLAPPPSKPFIASNFNPPAL